MPTIALVDDDRNILTSVSIALEGEGYRVQTYTDGSTDRIVIDAFTGSAAMPLPDDALSAVFRATAADRLTATRIEDILAAVWSLESAPSLSELISLTT